MKAMTVMRERSLPEIFDLAIILMRKQLIPICLFSGIGILPLILVFAALLNSPPMEGDDIIVFWWLLLLSLPVLYSFSQFGTSWYLGQKQFFMKPTFRSFLSALRKSWFSYFVVAFLLKPITYITGLLPLFFPSYYPEVIVLEQQSLSKCWSRLMVLSKHDRTPVIVYNLLGTIFVITVVAAGNLAFNKIGSIVRHQRLFEESFFAGGFGFSLSTIGLIWFCFAFLNVVRFCNYLDARTRIEGWHLDHTFDNLAEEMGYARES